MGILLMQNTCFFMFSLRRTYKLFVPKIDNTSVKTINSDNNNIKKCQIIKKYEKRADEHLTYMVNIHKMGIVRIHILDKM